MKIIKINREIKLLDRCLKKERRAQEEFYQKYSNKMFFVCKRYFQDEYLAQECLLKGFLKVYDKLDTFKKEGSLEGWIRKIMVRTCLDELRKTKHFLSLEDFPSGKELEPIDSESKEFEEEDLLRALNVLKPLAKTIFNLYAIEGYKHKEIGELLQISEGASKTHLSRARKILQNELQKTRGYEVEYLR